MNSWKLHIALYVLYTKLTALCGGLLDQVTIYCISTSALTGVFGRPIAFSTVDVGT